MNSEHTEPGGSSPLRPQPARLCPPLPLHIVPAINQLNHLYSQCAQEMVQGNQDPVSEEGSTNPPGTPVIILSSTTSSTPYVIWTPSLLPADKLEEQLVQFWLSSSYFSRPPTPYPSIRTHSDIRDNRSTPPDTVFDPDDLWDSITPSAFLSISTFIPPPPRPATHSLEQSNYPSHIDWDQPI